MVGRWLVDVGDGDTVILTNQGLFHPILPLKQFIDVIETNIQNPDHPWHGAVFHEFGLSKITVFSLDYVREGCSKATAMMQISDESWLTHFYRKPRMGKLQS